MGAQLRMAYQRIRQRSLGQVTSELQEAEANLSRATRGSFAEEYAENRVRILKREKAAMEKSIPVYPEADAMQIDQLMSGKVTS